MSNNSSLHNAKRMIKENNGHHKPTTIIMKMTYETWKENALSKHGCEFHKLAQAISSLILRTLNKE